MPLPLPRQANLYVVPNSEMVHCYCRTASYLEEEVAVDEPSGVAEADKLHDLGELQKPNQA